MIAPRMKTSFYQTSQQTSHTVQMLELLNTNCQTIYNTHFEENIPLEPDLYFNFGLSSNSYALSPTQGVLKSQREIGCTLTESLVT